MKIRTVRRSAEELYATVKKKKIIITMVFAAAVIAGAVIGAAQRSNPEKMFAGAVLADASEIKTAIVGENTGADILADSGSWPGEIISLGNIAVQPAREGTISEWYVRIGQYVKKGEALGTLSRPPQTPDAVAMLSEKTEDISRTRSAVFAEREYSASRISQLEQLRADTKRQIEARMNLLGQANRTIGENSGSISSSFAVKQKLARTVLRGSIAKTFPMMFTQAVVPNTEAALSSVQLKPMIGAVDSGLSNTFRGVLSRVLTDLKNENGVPAESGLLYFDTALKIASASIADGSSLTEKELDSLKKMLIEDQSMFISVLAEMKDIELESVGTQKELTEKLAEIDKESAELKKTLAMSEGEITAKEAAYRALSGNLNGGYSIVAPRSGTVSVIMKKPGEFVGPGMPVAVVTGSGAGELLVRMSIPSNVKKPKIGETLSVVRHGFASEPRAVRLAGVGSALNETGSYMADAVFAEASDWPVGAAVRVIVPESSSAITVKNSAVLFGEDGKPFVWGVTDAGRVFKRSIVLGRILGENAEAYEGLKKGDRYITKPNSGIREDMLIGDIASPETEQETESSYEEAMRAMGM
jgi:multidrug efflux pump subunit AcrA (membrane-fusion protein)